MKNGEMRAWLRRSGPEDAAAFCEVKRHLPLPDLGPDVDGEAVRGGFLLGTSEAQYREFITRDLTWTLEAKDGVNGVRVEGFAIVLCWETLRESQVWHKRHEARLEMPDSPEAGVFAHGIFHDGKLEDVQDGFRIAYYEQLAVLPQTRAFAGYLALRALEDALETHDVVLATTVREPAFNPAAHAFMRSVGFFCVGEIEEHYDGVGRVLSEIHLLERARFLECRRSRLFTTGIERARREGFVFAPELA